MSTATKNTASTKEIRSHEEGDFVLKHRVTGAAVLLFFGAMFLPWLLGAPDAVETSDLVSNSEGVLENDLATVIDQSEEGLADLEQQFETDEVFISKITPVDQSSELQEGTDAGDAGQIKTNVQEPRADSSAPKESSNPPSQTEVVTPPLKASLSQVESSQASENSNVVSKVPDNKTETSKNISIEIGWAVQVGVFIDKSGASRVVQDLRSKGFEPSTTIVDTNRGKATGTRIWLGPYAQRVDAAKAKATLLAKTGEPGFIRRYP